MLLSARNVQALEVSWVRRCLGTRGAYRADRDKRHDRHQGRPLQGTQFAELLHVGLKWSPTEQARWQMCLLRTRERFAARQQVEVLEWNRGV